MQRRRSLRQWLADKLGAHLTRDEWLSAFRLGQASKQQQIEAHIPAFTPPPETPVRTNTVSTLNPPPSLSELAASNEAFRQRNQDASAEIRTQHHLPRFDLAARQAAFREQMKQRKQGGQA